MRKFTTICAVAALALAVSGTAQAVTYDQNVTPDIIFGDGNANGAFTVDRTNGVELGLRAKLRHGATGAPDNIFNSNGDGTYTFNAGVAPGQSASTAEWCFEWSANTDYDGTSGLSLDDLTYQLLISGGTSLTDLDVITGPNPGAGNVVLWDHAIGNNTTANGAGVSAGSVAGYAFLLGDNNVAQNSWKPHWFIGGFDPTAVTSYNFTLNAFGLNAFNGQNVPVASTRMTVNVVSDQVPEPTTIAMLALGSLAGLAVIRRRRK